MNCENTSYGIVGRRIFGGGHAKGAKGRFLAAAHPSTPLSFDSAQEPEPEPEPGSELWSRSCIHLRGTNGSRSLGRRSAKHV